MFLLAFAIVDAENNSNWQWFLENLSNVVSKNQRLTFMSDRHSGLVSGIPLVFPDSYHGYCLWHLKNNFRLSASRGCKTEYLIKLFVDCAYAATHKQYQDALAILLSYGGDNVKKFLDSIQPEHWVSAYFEGEKYGVMSSGVAESFNNWVSEGRDLPVTAFVDFIRVKTMSKMSKNRDLSRKWSTILVPKMEEKLKKIVSKIGGWTAKKSNDGLFEVSSEVDTNGTYRVDLFSGTCSCNIWRILRFPCKHAVFCILSSNLNVYDFIDKVHMFFLSSFILSY